MNRFYLRDFKFFSFLTTKNAFYIIPHACITEIRLEEIFFPLFPKCHPKYFILKYILFQLILKLFICIPIFKYTLLNYTWADCVPISSPNKSRQQQTERFCHWHILRDLSYLEHDASKIIRKLRAHTPKGSQGRLEIN